MGRYDCAAPFLEQAQTFEMEAKMIKSLLITVFPSFDEQSATMCFISISSE